MDDDYYAINRVHYAIRTLFDTYLFDNTLHSSLYRINIKTKIIKENHSVDFEDKIL